MSQRRRYEESFKLHAARLVTEQGYSYAQAAERLGVNVWTLRDWVRKLAKSEQVPDGTTKASAVEELKRLRKENERLRMENEILKKATAYFAKDSL